MEKSRNNQQRDGVRGISVDTEFGQRVTTLRQVHGIDQAELSEKAGVSRRLLTDLEGGKRTSFQEVKLLSIAEALGVTLPQLLDPEFDPTSHFDRSQFAVSQAPELLSGEFELVASLLHEIDNYVVSIVRDHVAADSALITAEYEDLLLAQRYKRNFDVPFFLRTISNPESLRRFAHSLPKPDLEVKIDKSLRTIRYRYHRKELVLSNPLLVWDCNCKTPDLTSEDREGRTKKQACPIHKRALGDEVAVRFGTGLVSLDWDGTKIYWKRGPEFWPPSVDSLGMLLDLQAEGVADAPANSLLDLGCGSGILGVAITARNPHIEKFDFADWLLTPLFYTAVSWYLNAAEEKRHTLGESKLGINTDWITSATAGRDDLYDLVLCNPPYLPLLGEFEIATSSTVAGTELLRHIIANARRIGKQVYVQFSHLAKPEAERAAQSGGVELRPIGPKEGRTVPFRVSAVWEHHDYLRALIKERDLIVRPSARHQYWHQIQTYVVE